MKHLEKLAEKYAKVEFVGLNRRGEPMYQASSIQLLEQCESKMRNFRAGYLAAVAELRSEKAQERENRGHHYPADWASYLEREAEEGGNG